MASERQTRAPVIAIDARQSADGSAGGVAWVTEGLLRGLAALEDGRERWLVVACDTQRERLQALCGDRMELVVEPHRPLSWLRNPLRDAVYRSPRVQRVLEPVRVAMQGRRTDREGTDHLSRNAVLDAIDCDLIHFPSQRCYATRVPSIYNPHDLQHLHYPQFFTRVEFQQREQLYRAGCAAARRIAVSSEWGKHDLMASYSIAADKIQVIPWGIEQTRPRVSPTDCTAVRKRLGLHEQQPFALYPAATWQHKNHLGLLDALARLREHSGVALTLVCSGHKNGYFPTIERRIRNLGLDEQVRFPGVLPRKQLDALYSQALFVVIPSLFEASSALMREAWRWQRPVACAAVTSLPEQAGGSVLLFDPECVDDMANAMQRLTTDERLRAELVAAGDRRIGRFTWRRTASAYRALYRTVTGFALTETDRTLLGHNWMSEQ